MPQKTADLKLDASAAQVEATYTRRVKIELTDVHISEIIEQIGEDVILDEIGRDAAVEHFDIEESRG